MEWNERVEGGLEGEGVGEGGGKGSVPLGLMDGWM